MNPTPIQTRPPIDPVAFAAWVHKVAAINETFSEVIRDTADIIATHDAAAARGLYQAADTASNTVHQLRISTPIPVAPPAPEPTPVLLTVRARGWYVLGFMCGLLVHFLASL